MSKNELVDFMKSATRGMEDEYKRILVRATEDPGTAGDQGEENWASLLRGWLPHTVHIVTKGRILSHDGKASPQVDIIVLKPEYPPSLLDKKLYLAGGVIAAFECKTTLKASHVTEFIQNSIEIKNHLEKVTGSPYKELQSPLIYGLLAHSHSWKNNASTPIENIENALMAADESLIKHPIQMPDLLCIADLACWSTMKLHVPVITSNYICHSDRNQELAVSYTPIGAFITCLLHKLAWENNSLRSLSKYFDAVNMLGDGRGYNRNWPPDIFSSAVQTGIRAGKLVQATDWAHWSMYIR